jgi:signal transduction histidine kinase
VKSSIRLRFALACGGVFLVAGLAVLGGVALIVRQSLERRDGLGSPEYWRDGNMLIHANAFPYDVVIKRVEYVRRVYQADTVHNVLVTGSLVLLAGGAVAIAAGWRTARWAMRPIESITEDARRVAQSHDLSGRISHEGLDDDVTKLVDVVNVILGRLARSFDGQRRFIANASHELRTPLTINRTLVDVAVRRADATDDVRRLGESLLLVNTRHERLIDGLLALTEGEQAVVDRRPFDLADVAEHVLDTAASDAAGREVTVHRLLDPAPTSGEPVLVERLVQNLVENAIRHNEAGGQVWVTTRRRAERVELVVANTGLPVPPYEIETIFEPFRRLHADRLRSDRGSGLGLSIVRVVAEAHGGTVAATSREEGGLTLTVELPYAQD